ncbi:MAG: Stealth CR1 domain-containing protein [Albidovulum sp.]|uniref:Stealth CR1 domain-containing protein n=1 Tax=Albidovulum sp. TaxID=1872424 RepID=UPI003C8D3868
MTDIDAVVAWVDGNDPRHVEKRKKYRQATRDHAEATRNTRFDQSGEIYFCVASILKYAPFVRKIWIITDDQRPMLIDEFARAGLCSPDKIEIVDHKTILSGYEQFLPTFNSLVVESAMHRIPGLADKFIYFNDDFFLNRPQKAEDWFTDAGPVLRTQLLPTRSSKFKTKLRAFLRRATFRPPNTKPSFGRNQEAAAARFGLHDQYWAIGHHAHPVRKKTLQDYYNEHPDLLEAQLQYRFRSVFQVLPVSLANHIEIVRFGVKPIEYEKPAYVKPTSEDRLTNFLENIRAENTLCGCIQSLDEAPEDVRKIVVSAMCDKLSSALPPKVKAFLSNSDFSAHQDVSA